MHSHTPHGLRVRMFVSMALLGVVYAIPVAAVLLIGVPWPVVAVLAVLTVTVQWFGTEWLARQAAGARFVDANQEPELHAVLDRLCALNDLPKPRVAVSLDSAPNAFTVGRSRRHTTVVVTSGLLRTLEPDELTAVLAHEIAHIRHRDVAVMTLASSFAIALAWIGRNTGRTFLYAPGELLEAGLIGVAVVVVGAFAALLGALAQLPLRALSRYRELAADHGAAVQLGQPALLASALLKVHNPDVIPRTDLRVSRIPALGLVARRPARLSWLSTHPPLAKRVNRLEALLRR
ncbi:M48 family metalloprotease [Streptosporangium carneum]|uniref:Protease HtpX n=1 Tax=Streptosporangium carneum TaxID=47481 RepID=A0A9W6MHF7_9ACTN|nr:M48 family metalloprotease [Streptosporangium carneum]GLK14127.1 protease HtpX [Streptosporangium carneum]